MNSYFGFKTKQDRDEAAKFLLDSEFDFFVYGKGFLISINYCTEELKRTLLTQYKALIIA